MADNSQKTFQRRSDKESSQVGDYFDHSAHRYFDHIHEITVVKVYSGDCYVNEGPGEMMVTILGSCISACIRDPLISAGGMNHFLLPSASREEDLTCARFGAYAMEKLINDLMKKGAKKERLELKLFGGGNVIESGARIGEKNVAFIREYVRNEGLRVVKEDLGGTAPRRIHYYPDSGRVMMRKLSRKEDFENVRKEETVYQKKLDKQTAKQDEDIELF